MTLLQQVIISFQLHTHVLTYSVAAGTGTFKFMTVRGAGHMVPTDNPAAGLEVLSKLIDISDNGSGYVDDDVSSNSNSSNDDRYLLS